MKLRTRHALGETALGAALASRSRLLAALSVVTLVLFGQLAADAMAGRVGHTVKTISVPNADPALSGDRTVKVHLWYPADQDGFASAHPTVYTSALYGKDLPNNWSPLRWTVQAEIARDTEKIDSNGGPFPVIVFSHGNVNDPIDYAHTLELIADAGFVVAAPYHSNNTQDDVLIDYINSQAHQHVFDCLDGRTSGDCSRTNLQYSITDRVNDIKTILDELPKWFGDRVDVGRVGLLGHSRGTATVLHAAGGSKTWNIEPVKNVDAVMGLAIAARNITFAANLDAVTVPTLLVAGGRDQTSPAVISQDAYKAIASKDKKLVLIDDAVHRTFDSTYCDQTQAAGAFAQEDPNAILDRHTASLILAAPTSGKAMDYCTYPTFTKPTDIRPLVKSLTGFEVTEENVPTTGLTSDAVKARVKALAVPFFGKALGAKGEKVTDTPKGKNVTDTPDGGGSDEETQLPDAGGP